MSDTPRTDAVKDFSAPEGLYDLCSALERALTIILPMAKGYAAEHPVGRNAEMVAEAEAALRGTEGGHTE